MFGKELPIHTLFSWHCYPFFSAFMSHKDEYWSHCSWSVSQVRLNYIGTKICKWYTYSRFFWGRNVMCAVVWSCVVLKPQPASTRVWLSPAANDSRSRCYSKQRPMGELLIYLAQPLFFLSITRSLLLSHICTFTQTTHWPSLCLSVYSPSKEFFTAGLPVIICWRTCMFCS